MTKKITTLGDLLLHELKDLYDAEHRVLEALPKMAKKSTHPELKRAFDEHLEQTQEHVRRLEQAFTLLGQPAKKKTCTGMKGLIEESEEMLKADMSNDVRDAALIAAAQRVEHYEVAAYGCARAFAEQMGDTQTAHLLGQTLEEEQETDQLLTQLAVSGINASAADGEA